MLHVAQDSVGPAGAGLLGELEISRPQCWPPGRTHLTQTICLCDSRCCQNNTKCHVRF